MTSRKHVLALLSVLVTITIIVAVYLVPMYSGGGVATSSPSSSIASTTSPSSALPPGTYPVASGSQTSAYTISTYTTISSVLTTIYSITSTSTATSYTTATSTTPSYPWGKPSVSGVWRIIGPDGGDMHFVYVTSKHIVFASHGFGGVWRSDNGGELWELIVNDGFVELAFHSMDEYSDGVLVAGTNKGLWASFDDGVSWSRVETGVDVVDYSGCYDIYSVVALKDGGVAFTASISRGCWRKAGLSVYDGFFVLDNGSLRYYGIPGGSRLPWTIVHLAYDPCFNGSEVFFVSSSLSGLWVYRVDSGVWEKVLDGNTTKVYVDRLRDTVYVGTIGDWFYRGRLGDSGWRWEHIVLPGLSPGVAEVIIPDPYDPDRLWMGGSSGSRGIPYRVPESLRGSSFVAVGWYRNGSWVGLSVKGNWGVSIAVDKHGEGEDPGDYTVTTRFGVGAKIAYVAQAGRGNIQKTVDGGFTWFPSYNGIYADTVNIVSYIGSGLWAGALVVTCVSGTQLSIDLGETWVEGIDFTIGDIGYGLPGYQWATASPEAPLEGRYDLLVATGYPPEQEGGNGVYAVDTDCLISGGRGCFKLLVPGPAHDIVVNGSILYIGRMDSGVQVYDLLSGSTWYLDGIPSGEAGIDLLLVGDTLFVATEKGGNRGSDNYFFTDPRSTGGLYACRDYVCTPLYTGERVVAFSVYGSIALLLTNNHKLVLIEDIGDPEPIVITLPPATYSDMAVDWDNGIVYLSTFDRDVPGVYCAALLDIIAGYNVELHPLINGLMTYSIRDLELVGNVLFAGSQGYGVWKIELIVSP